MNRILYSSPYIPPQWIEAHCLEPYFAKPSNGCAHECVARVEGLCEFSKAWVSEALADDRVEGIVLALTCDQMRRVYEVLCEYAPVPCFLFNVPATWQTVQSRQLYRDELQRLGRFLLDLGGRSPSKEILAERMLTSGIQMDPSRELKQRRKIPLALAGPHETVVDPLILEAVAQADAGIVLGCSPHICTTFDRRAVRQDPFSELADACFDAIQDIFQRPNSGFYRKLDHDFKQTPVKGIIVRRYLWCDLWHAEMHRLKQFSPVPVLDLEIGGKPMDDRHRLTMRIQSFMEMVQ